MLKTTLIVLLILFLLALAAGFYLATYVAPYAIVQPPRKVRQETPATYGLTFEHTRLATADGTALDAFYIPATVPARSNLIMLHGVGSCKEVYLGTTAELTALGYNVLLWDQRAHGKSEGQYLSYGYREKEDVSLAIDWLENKNPGLPTGIYGNSMGGAIALQSLAHDGRLGFGLIESTFQDLQTTTYAYGRRMSGLPLPRWLTNYVLDQAGKIADFPPRSIQPLLSARAITQPVLLIHGDTDRNIGIENAHALFAALASADKELYTVQNGDHADLWDKGGDLYREAWFGFLKRMVATNGIAE